MKQHITVEQLNELSSKVKKKYEKLFRVSGIIEYADIHGTQHLNKYTRPKKGIVYLVSIGQMIEVLAQKDYFVGIEKGRCSASDDDCGMEHEYWFINNDPIYKEELVDCLWEAIKVVLKEKEV